MWDLVPWPGIEPGPPALGEQSLSHWTTREVPSATPLVDVLQFLSHLPDALCSYFQSWATLTVLVINKGTQSRLLSFAWTLQWTRALVPAEASGAHPPPWRIQTNLDESLLVLRFLILVDDPEFYLAVYISHVADKVLVLWPGVRPVPLRWQSQVRDIAPPETAQLHVISNGKSSPRDLHLNAKTQLHSMTASYSAGHPMPNN